MGKIKSFFISNKFILITIILLIILTFSTRYFGSMDIGDYINSAKYFAEDSQAKTRNAHSYSYGLLASPFLGLTKNLLVFKFYSLIFLFLIIYSVYFISNKDKKSIWLILLSPIVWYMAPWISPIQLSSLLVLWAYYFICKHDKEGDLKSLFYSGVLWGLALCFWNTILYFTVIFVFAFFYNKRLSYLILFIFGFLIGLMPLFIIDTLLFNFPFYSLAKTTFSQFLFVVGGSSIYGNVDHSGRLLALLLVLLSFPIYFWVNYKPNTFKENKNTMIFLSLSILMLMLLPSSRIIYTLSIIPIMTLVVIKNINDSQFKKQIIFSILIIILFTIPYIIQINYNINNSINGEDITFITYNIKNISLSSNFPSDLLSKDISSISKDYPDETFLVGNNPDDYQILADLYWGKNIKEFVSIQDYDLWLNNKTILFQKKFMPVPNIQDRRQIWITGGLSKNEQDLTDYKNIVYAISFNANLNEEGFKLIKKYKILYLYKKQDLI